MRAFLRWVLLILGMGIGGVLVALSLEPDWTDQLAVWMRAPAGRITAASIAIVLLASPLAMLLRWMQALRRSREIHYDTEAGRISVNLIAVEEALTRAIEREPEIKKAHVRVFEDRVRKAVIIEAALTMWEVPNVTERNRFCQRLLRRRFAELMPECDDVQVNLMVHRLNVRGETVAMPSAAPLPTPTVGESDPELAPAVPAGSERPRPELPTPQDEDELYVGPAYPVSKQDEDEVGTSSIRAAVGGKGGRGAKTGTHRHS